MRRLAVRGLLIALVLSCSCRAKEKAQEDPAPVPPPDSTLVVDRPPTPPPPPSELAPPVSLTASDGTGLALTRLHAKAVIDGPLAFTELHLRFRNPNPRVIEGRFAITLPQEASISRLAMMVDGGWQEAEVVERQAARRAYEDFLHRRQDPALLEKEAGNEFRARIFPIPANGDKDLIVSYAQPLAGREAPYRLPLRGLPEIAELQVTAQVATGTAGAAGSATTGYRVVTMEQRGYVPNKDFEVPVPAEVDGVRSQGIDGGEVIAVRVTPKLDAADQEFGGLTVLFDTSASRALGYRKQVERLGKLIRDLAARHGAGEPLTVAAFDQSVVPVYEGTLGGFDAAAEDRLRGRRALGASDLQAALAWAGARDGSKRLVVITDGIATAGQSDGDELRAAAKALANKIERIDVILVGGIRDQETAERLARGALARDGVVLDGDQPVEVLARRLSQTTVSGIAIQVENAGWSWPRTLNGAQPGDDFLVYARMAPGALSAGGPLRVTLSGSPATTLSQTLEIPLTTVARPLIERAGARAEIARLQAERDDLDVTSKDQLEKQQQLKQQIIDISTRFRVLSDYTALLVLETENDYRRFGIERRSLVDIMTVGERGVELIQRNQAVLALPVKPQEPVIARAERERADAAKEMAEKKAELSLALRSDPGAAAALTEEVAAMAADGVAAGMPAPADNGRASGQYAMRNENADPQLARAQVLDQARNAGIVGSLSGMGGGGDGDAFEGLLGDDEVALRGRRAERSSSSRARPRPRPARAPAPERPLEDLRLQDPAPVAPERRPPPPPPPPPTTEPAPQGSTTPGFADVPPSTPRPGFGDVPPPMPDGPAALEGKLADVKRMLQNKQAKEALQLAHAWHSEAPGDVLALLALAESLEAMGDPGEAARAYGSIIDLFPSRADMRRFAGQRLEGLGDAGAKLAVDTYQKSVEQRPDHLTGHRLLAMALVRRGQYSDAFDAAVKGIEQRYPPGRFLGGTRILRDDLGLIAAAWIKNEPKARGKVMGQLKKAGAQLDKKPSLRFVLTWETDANDVDFHIHDSKGGHAYYSQPRLPSGGELYADVTTGYGPECFTIPGPAKAHPYTLRLHYYSRGPMGYGMGKLEVIEHDGKGGLTFEQRPFVVMNDRAYVDLGQVKKP